MQTVEEFMRGYFCARDVQVEKELACYKPFRDKYFTPTCCWGNRSKERQQYDSETVESVAISGEDALAITCMDFIVPRLRYHLTKSSESWLISSVEGQCPACLGENGNTSCGNCRGTGWMDAG